MSVGKMKKTGRGGRRAGAGRPTGSGRFGDKPLAKIALPIELREEVIQFAISRLTKQGRSFYNHPEPMAPEIGQSWPSPPPPSRSIPLFRHGVRAGLASDADASIEKNVDLNALLIRHDAETFLLRVEGDSMTGAGIFDDDLLVVDRSIVARHGDIVIARLHDTEFTCKRLHQRTDRLALLPENPDYPAIEIGPKEELSICGVVTGVIRKLK